MASEHGHHHSHHPRKLTLMDGEEILLAIRRHWLTGVIHMVLPVGVLLVLIGLYLYSATGGGFTVAYRGGLGFSLDLLDWLYIGLLAFLGAMWLLMGIADKAGHGHQQRRWGLVAMMAIVAVVLAFRAAGGEIFEPNADTASLINPFGLVMLLMAAVAGFVVVYELLELLHDYFILTNRRVIYYNGAVLIPRLIERQVQQELMLEDVQNVLSRTETYLQHWLNYGNITVQAANAGRPLIFHGAAQAKEMQRRIFGARADMLKRNSSRNFAQLIDTRVYDDKRPKEPYAYAFPVIRTPPGMRWVLDDNPRVDVQQGQITWYPHWFFLARALLLPLGFLAIAAAALALGASFGLLTLLPVLIIGAAAVATFALWVAYQVEDYRNDRYMLTGVALVDIDKRPFGPESRRSAGLGTIQTVTYTTTFFSNLLGYGDVVAKTAGQGGAFTFTRVPRPRDVAATINQHISAYRKGERERTLDESLSLLRQFHMYQGKLGELRPKADS